MTYKYFYLLLSLGCSGLIPAQVDTFAGTFTYEYYTTVEGEQSYVDLLATKVERFTTVKIFVNGNDSLFIESYDADDKRKSISIITLNQELVYFDNRELLMDFTNISRGKDEVQVRYKKLRNEVDTTYGLPARWYRETSSVGEGKALVTGAFPYVLPDIAKRYGLYYVAKKGLIVEQEIRYNVNENFSTNRYLRLVGYSLNDDRPELPDTDKLTASKMEGTEITPVVPD